MKFASKAAQALIGLSGAGLASLPAMAATAEQWVMGYYVAYERDSYPVDKIDWSGLTHLIMGRVKANADGTLDASFDWDPVHGPALARDMAVKAHAAGKKAILMLGGSDNGEATLAALKNHRAAFVQNLLKAMKNYGYDGLDLDWETHLDWSLFLALVKDLRQAAPNILLTVPAGAINLNFPEGVEPGFVPMARYVDRINLMSYYPSTSWAGSGWLSWFNSPLKGAKGATPVSIEDSLQRYVDAGIPRKKLGMGIGFYATCYTGGITRPDQGTENGVSIQGGDHEFMLSDLYGTNGAYAEASRHWWSAALQPYLSLPQPERHGCRYISFEDEHSIVEKGKFSRAQGYGGTIIWTINQGYVKTHSQPNFLMQALRKGFLAPTAPQKVGLSLMQGNSWLKTSAQLRFSALVTGTSDKAVGWSVAGTDCGRVDAGLYTAPAVEKRCTLTATSHADPALSATATVTISNTPWTPTFQLSRSGTWWLEVTAQDPSVASLSLQWPDGTWSPLPRYSTQWGTGLPIFVGNYKFPDSGATYVLQVRSANNRSAKVKLKVPACVHGDDGICH